MARQKIREIAEARGYTAARLARKADLAYGTVKGLWDDPEKDTTISTLSKIAEVLRVQASDLLDEAPTEATGDEIRMPELALGLHALS